jgi:uncharacterized membrane protein YjjB (DUF3815 family)
MESASSTVIAANAMRMAMLIPVTVTVTPALSTMVPSDRCRVFEKKEKNSH